MPVAGEGENQDERPDNQDAGGFKFINGALGRAPRGRLMRLWADGGHKIIVAPRSCGAGAPPAAFDSEFKHARATTFDS